jgi:hypothetical protein
VSCGGGGGSGACSRGQLWSSATEGRFHVVWQPLIGSQCHWAAWLLGHTLQPPPMGRGAITRCFSALVSTPARHPTECYPFLPAAAPQLLPGAQGGAGV